MSKREIIEYIAKERWVEKIARHFNTFAKKDLCQYIYLYLLEKVDEDKMVELWQNKQLKQFITGMLYRQVISTTSHYIRTYHSEGTSYDNDTSDFAKTIRNTLEYDDEKPHQIEDKVDEYLQTLTDEERDLAWIATHPTKDRMDDIEIWCKKYNHTYTAYERMLPMLKTKMKREWGKKNIKHHYTQNGDVGKIYHLDKDGNIIKIYNSRRDCVNDLCDKGYNKDVIYKCIQGVRLSHRGEKFIPEKFF